HDQADLAAAIGIETRASAAPIAGYALIGARFFGALAGTRFLGVVRTADAGKRQKQAPREDRGTFHLRCSGRANASSESPIFVPSDPCPPAMISTYCLP